MSLKDFSIKFKFFDGTVLPPYDTNLVYSETFPQNRGSIGVKWLGEGRKSFHSPPDTSHIKSKKDYSGDGKIIQCTMIYGGRYEEIVPPDRSEFRF